MEITGPHKPALAGVDLRKASADLKGLPARRLLSDWLGVDPSGQLAIFLGDDTSPLPPSFDTEGASRLIETVRASFDGFTGGSMIENAYRASAHRAREPVFDVPRNGRNEAIHEEHFSGYPHLVIAAPDGAPLVRQAMEDHAGRELLSRAPFAVMMDLGPMTYAALHQARACAGCRVLDQPEDPRSRSPELLASVGLYVYGFSAGLWVRITSPAVPADADDLVAMGGAGLAPVVVGSPFETSPFIESKSGSPIEEGPRRHA